MNPLAPKIITILQKYIAAPSAPLDPAITLTALEIDCLDMPMIFLDIEDVFDVQVACEDEADKSLTVGGLIGCVSASLDAKREAASRPVVRRPKRNWMSTGVDR